MHLLAYQREEEWTVLVIETQVTKEIAHSALVAGKFVLDKSSSPEAQVLTLQVKA